MTFPRKGDSMPENEGNLYTALEEALKEASAPKTSVELYDMPQIRKLAESANRVSDYLGNLWRKGLALRHPAPRTSNSNARWMYSWKPQSEKRRLQAVEYTPPSKGKHSILSRPNIEITDDGGTITIDLPQLVITIRAKS